MAVELTKEYVSELKEILESGDANRARSFISEMHAADIAEVYVHLDEEEGTFLYSLLDPETAADVLSELEDEERAQFLKSLSSDVIARQLIFHMETDDAADVLNELSDEKKEEILQQIDDIEHAGDIADLLTYHEDTAGGLMAKELIKVNENWNLVEALREMRKQAEDVDEVYFVYVVDDSNVLKGIVSLKKLLLSSSRSVIKNLISPDIISVKTDTSKEEVANIMRKYDLVALPVIDHIGRLVGRITIDDVVDVITEEAEKDYQMISGISEDVESHDKIWILSRARLPWLLVGLTGGILVSKVIGKFEVDLGFYPEMAFFMPLIAASAGNVGVQSSSIVVQGLANNTLDISNTFARLVKEFMVALVNGITLATIVFMYNLFFSDSFALTITVSLALLSVIIFASLFGTLVPLALNKWKIDPAVATGPFITTSNDIIGLIIYFMIGRLMYGIF
jgi:magnesium transporter